jgi:hypothetical protein
MHTLPGQNYSEGAIKGQYGLFDTRRICHETSVSHPIPIIYHVYILHYGALYKCTDFISRPHQRKHTYPFLHADPRKCG